MSTKVNKTGRLILWEYALNDGGNAAKLENWVMQAADLFKYSSFGFLFIGDKNGLIAITVILCVQMTVATATRQNQRCSAVQQTSE